MGPDNNDGTYSVTVTPQNTGEHSHDKDRKLEHSVESIYSLC